MEKMSNQQFKTFLKLIVQIIKDSKTKEEAIKKWLGNGAQPTETVGKILKIAGITNTIQIINN